MNAPLDLVRQGLYLDAARVIDHLPDSPTELRIARANIEALVGSPSIAKRSAHNLLAGQLSARDRAQSWGIVGRIALGEGNGAEGVKALGRALEAASQVQDATLEADLLASSTESLLRCVGVEAASLELPKLRKAALRAGDAQSLIAFHCLNAEICAQRGALAQTEQSIDTAQSLLKKFPNIAQEGRLSNIRSCLAAANCDFSDALEFATNALSCGRRSGVRLLQLPSLNNLVNVLMNLGRPVEARVHLNELFASIEPGNTAELAYLDTQMLLALATDDLDDAAAAARRIDALVSNEGGRDSYYLNWHAPTRVRFLFRRNDVDAGVAAARKALETLRPGSEPSLVCRLRLLLAEGLERQGQSEAAQTMLVEACRTITDPSLELFAEGLRVTGCLSSRDDPRRSRTYFDQAGRILKSIGHLAAGDEVERCAAALSPETRPLLSLSDAISVCLESGSHVPTLAAAALQLISESGAVLRCTVTASGNDNRPTVVGTYASVDCDSPRSKRPISVEIGTHTGQRFQIDYVVRPTTDARATMLAIERIISAGAAVARDRKVTRSHTVTNWSSAQSATHLGLVCASEHTQSLVQTIQRIGQTTVSVLLTGETGVGKELFAKALHLASGRSDRTFLPFNCSTVPREMIDSQLFGHKRGSFTGAIGDSSGVIRAAAGGTLFLDEIGELSLESQPKLLRFLESGEILPLGETKPQHVDVRVVAATNANLDQLVAEGLFREDLYYRLNVIRLEIPPLRERREEIPALVEHFLEKFGRELDKPLIRIADETLEYLVLYRWPGNVRQLSNEIRRLVTMAEPGGVIMPAHLSDDIAESRRTLPANRPPRLFDEVVTRIDQPLSAAVEHIERAAIQRALAMTDGHLDDAARILGLSRKGLYLKRQRLNLG